MDIKVFFTSFVALYIEMVPYLAFGLLIAGVLHVLVNKTFILNHFGNKGILSVIKAAVLGVPLPLCSCSVVPTALSLKKHGASNGATLSFLISTPQTGVESIAATWGMMGPFFALFRPFAAFVTGIVGGTITTKMVEHEETAEAVSETVSEKKKRSFPGAVKELFHYGFVELMDDIGFNLLIGVFVSAVITVFIPDSFFTAVTGNPLLEMLVVLVGAVPLYVCATASIPIAAALLIKGVSPGAAFVFLMAGPATNAATITVLFSKLGRKMGFIYISVIVVSSLLFGALLNWGYEYLNIDPSQMMSHAHHDMDEGNNLMNVVALLFSIPLIYSIWKTKLKVPVIRFFRKSTHSKDAPVRVYSVGGITCKNCAGSLSDAAKLLAGVADASVDLENLELTVRGSVEEELVKDAVNKAGYQFGGVVRGTDVERTFTVSGMSCQNCVRHVTDAVISLSGVTDAVVSLEEKRLTLQGVEPDSSIIEAVEKAGYSVE